MTQAYGVRAGRTTILIPSDRMDEDLIGGDPLHRLSWGDVAGWFVEKQDGAGHWVQVAVYSETPPLVARHLAKWLSSQVGLTFDEGEDAVMWLREQSPSRFIDPFDEPDEGGGGGD